MVVESKKHSNKTMVELLLSTDLALSSMMNNLS